MGNTYHPNWGRARTRWLVTETRSFDVSAFAMETRAHRDLEQIVHAGFREERLGCWRGKLSHPMSLFDECEIEVTIGENGTSCLVRGAIAFDASPARVVGFVSLASSIVGTPAAYAWRAVSIGAAKRFARETFDLLWARLDGPDPHPYR